MNPEHLAVIKNEAPDTWIHGVMSDPGGIKTYRNLQTLSPAAEVLNTQLQIWNLPVDDATGTFGIANEQMMLYAEHTWGIAQNVKVYGNEFYQQPDNEYKNLEESWEDKTNYVRRSDSIFQCERNQIWQPWPKQLNYDGERLVVYNPLPWKRSGMIKIPDVLGGISMQKIFLRTDTRLFP